MRRKDCEIDAHLRECEQDLFQIAREIDFKISSRRMSKVVHPASLVNAVIAHKTLQISRNASLLVYIASL